MIQAGSRVSTLAITRTKAESTDAKAVDEANNQQFKTFAGTQTVGSAFYEFAEEFWNVVNACSSRNWDGFGATGLSSDTVYTAWRVGQVIPFGLFRPSVGAEPDGQITLEWHVAPRRTLSVSVDGAGNLHYAALLGSDRKAFGTESFVGVVPDRILDLIYSIIA